ncbi:12091_t:CDS:1 [Dentiscutata erythropus]|uniref:12091_t:CDS:1 n=1 Tax=Dentiscutata erythropus TaxID=1348616 RepID=A0A9N8WCN0_9GLOM|nr:12091_t:CDS:1 [Dentiscutata erythropus]
MTKVKRTPTRRMTVPGGENVDRKPLTAFNRSSTFPYSRPQSNNNQNKTNVTCNNYHQCSKCTKSGDDDVNCLSARINRLEKLIRDLNIAVSPSPKPKNSSNSAPSANSSLFCYNAIDFSKMETNELVSFSTQLGTLLFGNRNSNNHKSNVMSISNILAH